LPEDHKHKKEELRNKIPEVSAAACVIVCSCQLSQDLLKSKAILRFGGGDIELCLKCIGDNNGTKKRDYGNTTNG